MPSSNGLRTIALFEGAKGTLVLLAGGGVFALFHHDAQHVAEQLVRHFHLNPASHYPRIFIHVAEQATPPHLLLLAGGAALYSAVRFLEAYGLWCERTWAEWFAVISGAIYIPFEIWELTQHVTGLAMSALIVNVLVVAYLTITLRWRAR